MSIVDVIVVGAGPAGLALGTALVERGRSVLLVDPAPEQAWIPGYGTWDDDLDRLLSPEEADFIRATVDQDSRWSTALVQTDSGGTVRLNRGYLRFDSARLHQAIFERARRAGVQLHPGSVSALGDIDGDLQSVVTSSGRLQARLVIDATGRGLSETRALIPPGPTPGVQVAYGQRITVDRHPWEPGEMVLMDWRRLRNPAPEGGDCEQVPTFLYALPFSKTDIFVEETVLTSRPTTPIEICRSRLHTRLRQLGIQPGTVHEEEHCFIPMGGPLPDLSQSPHACLPFGAAAGFVHPATGYSLLQSLRLAPSVADAICDGWSITDGRGLVRAAWERMWPEEARRNRALYAYGQELLIELSLHEVQKFYDAFFAADAQRGPESALWPGYMADSLTTSDVARLMMRVFLAADGPTRLRLARGGTHSNHLELLGALLGA